MTESAATNSELVAATQPGNSELRRSGEGWELWRVEHNLMAAVVRQHFLFFTRSFRHQHIDEAAAHWRLLPTGDLTIVLRNGTFHSTDTRRTRLAQFFPGSRIYDTTRFLFEVVKTVLPPPKAPSDDGVYFIEPSVRFPDENDPVPALGRLEKWLCAPPSETQNVAVLLAPAGVGKTTLAEELFRSVSKKRDRGIIPLLLKREYWEDLARKNTVEMKDIWNAGMAAWYPEARLGAGTLEACLAAGAIRPILDGFDELCNGFPENFRATEVISNLIPRFAEGRILLASRREAWTEHVEKAVRPSVLEIDLDLFTGAQRDEYLVKRFPSDLRKRSEAQSILSKLAGRSASSEESPTHSSREPSFDRMPLAVVLAAESVDRPERTLTNLDTDEPLTGLLHAFCEREQLKTVKVDPVVQYTILELMALEFGYSFSIEDIASAAYEVASDLPQAKVDDFRNHALLRGTQEGRLVFRYDFIREYLAGRAVNNWLLQTSQNRFGEAALRSCEDATSGAAVIERWVELAKTKARAEIDAALKTAWIKAQFDSHHIMALSHMILSYARAQTRDRKECVRLIGELSGGSDRLLRGLHFRGAVTGLDLRESEVLDGYFDNTDWVKCLFSKKTVFDNCHFSGGLTFQQGSEMEQVTLRENCALSPKARLALQSGISDVSSTAVTYDEILTAVRETICLFTVNAMTFDALRPAVVEKHMRSYSFGNLLLKQLLKHNVLQRARRGVSADNERLEVADIFAARQFLNNAARVRGVGATIDALKAKLLA